MSRTNAAFDVSQPSFGEIFPIIFISPSLNSFLDMFADLTYVFLSSLSL